MKVKITKTFDTFLFILFVSMTILSLQFNTNARLLPLTFGAIGSIMLLVQLIHDFFPGWRSKMEFLNPLSAKKEPSQEKVGYRSNIEQNNAVEMNEVEQQDNNEKWEWQRVLTCFFSLLVFVIMLHYFGHLVAIPIFILFFVKFAFSESWTRSIITAVSTWLFAWLLFDVLLSFQV